MLFLSSAHWPTSPSPARKRLETPLRSRYAYVAASLSTCSWSIMKKAPWCAETSGVSWLMISRETVSRSFWPCIIEENLARFVMMDRSEEHTSELQSLTNLVCRLLLEKKKNNQKACTGCETELVCSIRVSCRIPEDHSSISET